MGKMTKYLKSNEFFLGFSLDVGCVLPAFSGTFQPIKAAKARDGGRAAVVGQEGIVSWHC
jgi:hypothetical protein